MMLSLLPLIVVNLLTAAHFLRAGDLPMVLVFLLAPLLLGIPRRTSLRIFQSMLAGAVVIWVDTGVTVVRQRWLEQTPWLRAAVILTAVAGFALWCLIRSNRPQLVARYKKEEHTVPALVAFYLSALLLTLFQFRLPLQLLLVERFFPGWGVLEVFGLALYAALATELILGMRHALWRQRLWLLFSAIFFTQFVLGLTVDPRFLQTGDLHIPFPALIVAGPLYRGGGFFMPLLFLSTVILVGPAWCSYLCYIGSWDGAMASLHSGRRKKYAYSLWVRGGALVITLAGALLFRSLMPPLAILLATLGFFIALSLGVMVYSARTGSMVHCSSWCPIGFLGNIIGKINPARVVINAGCTGCQKCISSCPYQALSKERILQRKPGLSCTLCGDCLSSCSHGALQYRLFGLSPAASKNVFAVMVMVLHTVFIAVARI
jgi:ferredoxin